VRQDPAEAGSGGYRRIRLLGANLAHREDIAENRRSVAPFTGCDAQFLYVCDSSATATAAGLILLAFRPALALPQASSGGTETPAT
jgi:hypothetical protein